MHGSYISFRRPDPFGRSDRHTRKKENMVEDTINRPVGQGWDNFWSP
jgi:hypothetical protein